MIFVFFLVCGTNFLAFILGNADLIVKELGLWVWLVSGWLWATYLAAINLPMRETFNLRGR